MFRPLWAILRSQKHTRTQNYVYTVKHLKVKDQFNMNMLYSEISLVFQTKY